ncbi:MAG: NUDIX domain-containing protein [Blautia sp.]|uniref:NUDIX domain-containing protein n=1 Tax=Agathobacter sp. TaxID=2021311 RepID=UPI003020A2D8
MVEHSGGILAYKYVEGKLEVMLAHPGGPFWARKDEAAWSIPKGLQETDESILDTAKREFEEETGCKIQTDLLELGTIKQPSKKLITIFAVEMEIDVNMVKSNLFEMEWPPKSGNIQKFPENDKAQWFTIEEARKKIFKGQKGFLDRLVDILNYQENKEEYTQMTLFD